jgi:fatty acid synthase subunit alpha, fungi type
MNDKNESSIIQDQLTHLGRTKGNTIMSVFQKHLTGHPKGAAGAWMINGCLQSLRTGLIPGNRNADNLDDGFQQYDFIAYTDKTIQTSGVKAFSVTSFGFGQKGAQVIGIHPKYLLATLQKPEYNAYMARVCKRQRDATAAFNEGILKNCLFVAKERPPYDIENEVATLLNPNARA